MAKNNTYPYTEQAARLILEGYQNPLMWADIHTAAVVLHSKRYEVAQVVADIAREYPHLTTQQEK
ncbi:MAG: hypothetical protein KA783_01900 [Chitinophagales bacterium]|nr:hypothetical protein [Chitinophagales bacterium]